MSELYNVASEIANSGELFDGMKNDINKESFDFDKPAWENKKSDTDGLKDSSSVERQIDFDKPAWQKEDNGNNSFQPTLQDALADKDGVGGPGTKISYRMNENPKSDDVAHNQNDVKFDSLSKNEAGETLDDNGGVFKDANGELLPNTEYTINGITYKTDDKGRIIEWDGDLKDTPDNERDNSAQSDAGGKDRQKNDDGGHLVARSNNGSSGNENLVAMRDTVNRGDYKKSEAEENKMLKDGKNVHESGKVTYDDDSSRPSKIEKTYTDGEKTVDLVVDNVEGSTDLLDNIKGDISEEDFNSFNDEIDDVKADGDDVSVTSVKKEYDADGNLKSVEVGVRNETTGEKSYRTYNV